VRAGGIVIAYLQIEGRDLELRREFPQRLLGWDTLPGLEAAEVGIGDAGRGELTLREAALLAQPPDARTDRLGSFPRHASQRRCGAVGGRGRTGRAGWPRSGLVRTGLVSGGREASLLVAVEAYTRGATSTGHVSLKRVKGNARSHQGVAITATDSDRRKMTKGFSIEPNR